MARKGQAPKVEPNPCPGERTDVNDLIVGPVVGKFDTPTWLCPECGKCVKADHGMRLDKHGRGSRSEQMQAELAYARRNGDR